MLVVVPELTNDSAASATVVLVGAELSQCLPSQPEEPGMLVLPVEAYKVEVMTFVRS